MNTNTESNSFPENTVVHLNRAEAEQVIKTVKSAPATKENYDVLTMLQRKL